MDWDTPPTTDFSKFVLLEENYDDQRFGIVTIYYNPENEKDIICIKTSQFSSEEDFAQKLQIAEERFRFSSPYILKMLFVQPDPERLAISIGFEYPNEDLVAQAGLLKQPSEVLKLAHDVLGGMAFLEGQKMVHGNIRPEYIYFNPKSGNYILLDRLGDYLTPAQIQHQNIFNGVYLYLDPASFASLAQNNLHFAQNPFKSESFALGMVAISMIVYEEDAPEPLPIQSLYDRETASFNEPRFILLLEELRQAYFSAPGDGLVFDFLTYCLLNLDTEQRLTPCKAFKMLKETLWKIGSPNFNSRENLSQRQEGGDAFAQNDGQMLVENKLLNSGSELDKSESWNRRPSNPNSNPRLPNILESQPILESQEDFDNFREGQSGEDSARDFKNPEMEDEGPLNFSRKAKRNEESQPSLSEAPRDSDRSQKIDPQRLMSAGESDLRREWPDHQIEKIQAQAEPSNFFANPENEDRPGPFFDNEMPERLSRPISEAPPISGPPSFNAEAHLNAINQESAGNFPGDSRYNSGNNQPPFGEPERNLDPQENIFGYQYQPSDRQINENDQLENLNGVGGKFANIGFGNSQSVGDSEHSFPKNEVTFAQTATLGLSNFTGDHDRLPKKEAIDENEEVQYDNSQSRDPSQKEIRAFGGNPKFSSQKFMEKDMAIQEEEHLKFDRNSLAESNEGRNLQTNELENSHPQSRRKFESDKQLFSSDKLIQKESKGHEDLIIYPTQKINSNLDHQIKIAPDFLKNFSKLITPEADHNAQSLRSVEFSKPQELQEDELRNYSHSPFPNNPDFELKASSQKHLVENADLDLSAKDLKHSSYTGNKLFNDAEEHANFDFYKSDEGSKRVFANQNSENPTIAEQTQGFQQEVQPRVEFQTSTRSLKNQQFKGESQNKIANNIFRESVMPPSINHNSDHQLSDENEGRGYISCRSSEMQIPQEEQNHTRNNDSSENYQPISGNNVPKINIALSKPEPESGENPTKKKNESQGQDSFREDNSQKINPQQLLPVIRYSNMPNTLDDQQKTPSRILKSEDDSQEHPQKNHEAGPHHNSSQQTSRETQKDSLADLKLSASQAQKYFVAEDDSAISSIKRSTANNNLADKKPEKGRSVTPNKISKSNLNKMLGRLIYDSIKFDASEKDPSEKGKQPEIRESDNSTLLNDIQILDNLPSRLLTQSVATSNLPQPNPNAKKHNSLPEKPPVGPQLVPLVQVTQEIKERGDQGQPVEFEFSNSKSGTGSKNQATAQAEKLNALSGMENREKFHLLKKAEAAQIEAPIIEGIPRMSLNLPEMQEFKEMNSTLRGESMANSQVNPLSAQGNPDDYENLVESRIVSAQDKNNYHGSNFYAFANKDIKKENAFGGKNDGAIDSKRPSLYKKGSSRFLGNPQNYTKDPAVAKEFPPQVPLANFQSSNQPQANLSANKNFTQSFAKMPQNSIFPSPGLQIRSFADNQNSSPITLHQFPGQIPPPQHIIITRLPGDSQPSNVRLLNRTPEICQRPNPPLAELSNSWNVRPQNQNPVRVNQDPSLQFKSNPNPEPNRATIGLPITREGKIIVNMEDFRQPQKIPAENPYQNFHIYSPENQFGLQNNQQKIYIQNQLPPGQKFVQETNKTPAQNFSQQTQFQKKELLNANPFSYSQIAQKYNSNSSDLSNNTNEKVIQVESENPGPKNPNPNFQQKMQAPANFFSSGNTRQIHADPLSQDFFAFNKNLAQTTAQYNSQQHKTEPKTSLDLNFRTQGKDLSPLKSPIPQISAQNSYPRGQFQTNTTRTAQGQGNPAKVVYVNSPSSQNFPGQQSNTVYDFSKKTNGTPMANIYSSPTGFQAQPHQVFYGPPPVFIKQQAPNNTNKLGREQNVDSSPQRLPQNLALQAQGLQQSPGNTVRSKTPVKNSEGYSTGQSVQNRDLEIKGMENKQGVSRKQS